MDFVSTAKIAEKQDKEARDRCEVIRDATMQGSRKEQNNLEIPL